MPGTSRESAARIALRADSAVLAAPLPMTTSVRLTACAAPPPVPPSSAGIALACVMAHVPECSAQMLTLVGKTWELRLWLCSCQHTDTTPEVKELHLAWHVQQHHSFPRAAQYGGYWDNVTCTWLAYRHS